MYLVETVFLLHALTTGSIAPAALSQHLASLGSLLLRLLFLGSKEASNSSHESSKTLLMAIPNHPTSDPPRKLAANPLSPIPPVHQHNRSIVTTMPNRTPDALIHGAHTRILIKVPRGLLRASRRDILADPLSGQVGERRGLDVLDLGFPVWRCDVGVWQADDDDAAAETVGKVDAFGHFAADDAEEEGALASSCFAEDGLGVFVEDVFARSAAGFLEECFAACETVPDWLCVCVLLLPDGYDFVKIAVAWEEDNNSIWDEGAEVQNGES